MVLTKVASAKDLEPGKKMGVQVGDKPILLVNVEGNLYAIGNKCTHRGCSLSDGTLRGDQIRCVCHGSTFDVKTGAFVKGPAKEPEPSYPVQVQQGQVMVDVST